MRIVDLSVALDHVDVGPSAHRPKITYKNHDETWAGFSQYFPVVPTTVMPENKAWASEEVSLITHCGTHMDAPWHYHPTTDHRFTEGGVPSPTIDQVPLEWCFQPGVKLDFRHVPDGGVLKPADLEAAFAKIGHTPKPLEIVLFNTRASAVYGTPAYFEAGCGIGRDATLWMTERGIRVVGTDAFGWDAPFVHVAKRFSETQDPSIIWEGHKAGREIGYYQMEKLHNLEALPPIGFRVACFPIKIKGASAGWVRAVALLED